MKNKKKIFLGLAAVAAMGLAAFYCGNIKTSKASCDAYCAYQPDRDCVIRWLDGDKYTGTGFVKVGYDEVEIRIAEIDWRSIFGN